METEMKTGFTGGSICTLLSILAWDDIVRTLVFTTIGAAVSFLVSYGLRELLKNKGNS